MKWMLSRTAKEPTSLERAGTLATESEPQVLDQAELPVRKSAALDTRKIATRPVKARRAALYVVVILLAVLTFTLYLSTRSKDHASSVPSLLNTAPSTPSTSEPEKHLAHELYLRGRFEWSKRTPESLNRALDYFTQAIVHDPNNAQAYAGLADTYNLLREFTMMPQAEAYKRAIAAAKKAIELDESLAEAHRSLAFDEVWGNWDFAAAEKEFQRAIELNPRDPIAHLWFANAFAAPGWYQICLREIDRAQELDPASHAILADKGLMLFHAGQTQQGLELLRQVEVTDPAFVSPHRYLAEMYLTLGDDPNFLWENERAAELSHDGVQKESIAAARAGFRQGGERGLFQRLYLAQKKVYDEGKLPGTLLAITSVQLGRNDEAIQLLRQEYDQHSPTFLMIRQHPTLLRLNREPGYQELVRMIHCPEPEITPETLSGSR